MGEMGNRRNRSLLIMKENLLIVFAKSIRLGNVKTRLAKTIGDKNALEVYKYLVKKTETNTSLVRNCDIHIYFSDEIDQNNWKELPKFIQQGNDLGERMEEAFQKSFQKGYKKVVGIGTDIPDLTAEFIIQAFEELDISDTVFGPAKDGGYYLLGMKKLLPIIFENKEWSTPSLLKQTFHDLKDQNISTSILRELNDIDTIEDLEQSSVSFLLHNYGKKYSI